jgi:hypothetical protein
LGRLRRGALLFLLTYAALALYWRGIYGYGFFGTDELKVFVSFERATDPGELLAVLLTPFTQHFMPVFKAFFFLEYSLFGMSSAPYHAVTVALYSISALLLWRFIALETGDRAAALFCAVVYAANSAYFDIVAWLFLQPFIMAVIFFLMALTGAARAARKGSYPVASAAFSLLSSYCIGIGALAWLFSAIYFVLRHRSSDRAGRLPAAGLLKRLSPLAASGAATFASYRLALTALGGSGTGFLVFDPVLLAKGTAVLYGDAILDTMGLYHAAKALAGYTGTDVGSLVPALRAAIFAAFFASAALGALYFRALARERKPVALAGAAFCLVSGAMVVAGRAFYLNMDVYEITDNIRYKYFPFVGLLVAASPYLAGLGRRAKALLMALLPFWLVLHSFILIDLKGVNAPRAEAINSGLAVVKASVDRPLGVGPDGRPVFAEAAAGDSRPLADVYFFQGQPMKYSELLLLFRKPGEAVVPQDGGGALYLRRHSPMGLLRAGEKGPGAGSLRLSSAGGPAFSVVGEAVPATAYEHLHLRIKADRPSSATLVFTTPDGLEKQREFEVKESAFHKLYLVPCPMGRGLRVELEPGEYSIRDARVYY